MEEEAAVLPLPQGDLRRAKDHEELITYNMMPELYLILI